MFRPCKSTFLTFPFTRRHAGGGDVNDYDNLNDNDNNDNNRYDNDDDRDDDRDDSKTDDGVASDEAAEMSPSYNCLLPLIFSSCSSIIFLSFSPSFSF